MWFCVVSLFTFVFSYSNSVYLNFTNTCINIRVSCRTSDHVGYLVDYMSATEAGSIDRATHAQKHEHTSCCFVERANRRRHRYQSFTVALSLTLATKRFRFIKHCMTYLSLSK